MRGQTSQLLLVVVVLGTVQVTHTLNNDNGNANGNGNGNGNGNSNGNSNGGRYPSYDDDSSQVNMEQMIKVNQGKFYHF